MSLPLATYPCSLIRHISALHTVLCAQDARSMRQDKTQKARVLWLTRGPGG